MGLEFSLDRILEANYILTDRASGTNLFLRSLLRGDALEHLSLNQYKKEKLINLQEQFPTC